MARSVQRKDLLFLLPSSKYHVPNTNYRACFC
jgi:hypothetical protein